jgi:hypothetical protein
LAAPVFFSFAQSVAITKAKDSTGQYDGIRRLEKLPHPGTMLISLTVGKVDAGVAVLLTEDKRLVRDDSLHTLLQKARCISGLPAVP